MSVERGPRVKPKAEVRSAVLERVGTFLEASPPGSSSFIAFVDQVKSLELSLNLGDALIKRDKREIETAADAYAKMRTVIVAQMREGKYDAAHNYGFGLMIGAYGGIGVFEDAERSQDPEIRRELRSIVSDFRTKAVHVHGHKEMDTWFKWFGLRMGV